MNVRGRRMPRDDVEHLLAVLDAAPAGMWPRARPSRRRRAQSCAEHERAAEIAAVDGPAGERARDLDHVLLRIAAVDAERVQLHQLARVVLVAVRSAGDRRSA